ncbi:hypothetical protein B0T13DRAFT_510360 [Neurospora crassa]|nr:hypothetical protein B0T13DRAFT_510360 [Neurospora crassa]
MSSEEKTTMGKAPMNAMSFNGPINYPPEPLKPETILKSGFIPYGFTSLKGATQRPDFA